MERLAKEVKVASALASALETGQAFAADTRVVLASAAASDTEEDTLESWPSLVASELIESKNWMIAEQQQASMAQNETAEPVVDHPLKVHRILRLIQ